MYSKKIFVILTEIQSTQNIYLHLKYDIYIYIYIYERSGNLLSLQETVIVTEGITQCHLNQERGKLVSFFSLSFSFFFFKLITLQSSSFSTPMCVLAIFQFPFYPTSLFIMLAIYLTDLEGFQLTNAPSFSTC